MIARNYADNRTNHNLPVRRMRLIGREQDTAGVGQAVLDSEGHLVTLTGTGGCGKTSLALHVAREMLDAFRDGVWLAELAPLADPALLDQAIATVLGVREGPEQPLRDALLTFLRPRALLLLLDNCEHLVEACAERAEALLGNCPELRILATSREPLCIPGEVIWRVPSLAAPDPKQLAPSDRLAEFAAVQLFVERARAVRPGFVLGSDNAAAVAQVCGRLEGLPLALELAAARMRAMAVGEIAARLDDSFRVLVGGSRTAPSRQQTLEATLDWSNALLTTPERTLFRRLSVFAGGFDLDAAEAVCTDAELKRSEVLDLLTRLVDKSLVVAEERAGEMRYRLLEPVRQYGRELLDVSDELDPTRARHAMHYRTLAKHIEWELWGPDQAVRLQRLERDRDNLRAALAWHDERTEVAEEFRLFVVALSRFWQTRGELREGRGWLKRAADKPLRHVTQGSVTVLIWASSLSHSLGDLDEAIMLGEQGVAASRELGDPVLLGSGLMTLADNLVRPEEDLDRAIAIADEAVQVLRDAGKPGAAALSVAMTILGVAIRLQGDLDRAAVALEEALTVSRDVGNTWALAMALQDLGHVSLERGEYERATALFAECLSAAQEIADSRRVAECLEGFGAIAARQGRAERAARLLSAAQALRDTNGSAVEAGDRPTHASSLAASRKALGEAAFTAAWDVGRAMPLEQIIEEALKPAPLATTAGANPPTRRTPVSQVSAREWEVAMLVARGLTNPQIAERLVISDRTVDRHVSNILDKLGFASRGQIAAWALELDNLSVARLRTQQ